MSRYEEVEDYNKDPCVRLFFAGCFLLLPREKEKPDTQARTGENDTKTISVDANLFENGAKQLRFRLKTDCVDRALQEVLNTCIVI